MSGLPLATAVAASLELFASERPQQLEFQLEVLLSSSIQRVVESLATGCDTTPEKLGLVIFEASRHLDKLEALRGAWRDPAQVLDAPNVPALAAVCRARLGRVHEVPRLRKLDAIRRKLEAALEHARQRRWIESFLGPPPPAPPEPEGG